VDGHQGVSPRLLLVVHNVTGARGGRGGVSGEEGAAMLRCAQTFVKETVWDVLGDPIGPTLAQ
jgi:hypothetical protein